MIRGNGLDKRRQFCKLALNDNQKAADELYSLADGLRGCKTVTDITLALSEIFCVSERTIFSDLVK